MPFPVHSPGRHLQHHRAAVPSPNLPRRIPVRRQMDVVPRHLQQPIAPNSVQQVSRRAVVQHLRRLHTLQLKVNLYRMPLVGTDKPARFIKRESLLAIPRYNLIKFCPADMHPGRSSRRKQRLHLHPSTGRQRQPKRLRLMPQVLAKVFAYTYKPLVVHRTNRIGAHFASALPLLSSSVVMPNTNAQVLITTHTIVTMLNTART
jgi:hypothetical protein